MSVDRAELLEQILVGYAGNYDIERTDAPGENIPLTAKASLHVTETGFVLIRKAEMWSANSNEYVYFFSTPVLTDTVAEAAIRYAYDDGMAKIDPKGQRNHMCTRLTAIFLCDEAEDAALERIRKCRLYKSFQFSLKGWMEFHAAAVACGKEEVTSNRYGRPTAEFLKRVLDPQPRKKNSRVLGMLKDMLD